jgi:hypothetical protein
MPATRLGFGLAAGANGKLYAVGGHDGNRTTLAVVEEYDPTTDRWTTRTPLPSARSSLGLALAPNGRLYAVGGDSFSHPVTVEVYSPP